VLRLVTLSVGSLLLSACGRPATPEYFANVTGIHICSSAKIANVNGRSPERSPGFDSVYIVDVFANPECRRELFSSVERRIGRPCNVGRSCGGNASSGIQSRRKKHEKHETASITARREEIEILELIGATASMIRRPYVVEGALIGLIASLLAVGISFGVQSWQISLLSKNLELARLVSQVSFLGIVISLSFIICGTFLGAFGAWMTVRKINDGWSAAQK